MTEVEFLPPVGEMATRIRAFDWSATPLGPIAFWPQSLRTATGLIVASPLPIVMLWGEDGVMIYNDGYSVFAAGRHPQSLGAKVCEAWPEVAAFNARIMRLGLAGQTLSYKDQELTLNRTGAPEQVWMNLDYSPVRDESGRPAGVIAIVVETTERVLAERRRTETEALLRVERDRARGVLENMAEGFVLLDHDFRVVDINAEGLRLGRRSRAAMIGSISVRAWSGSPDAPLVELFRRVLAERRPEGLEHWYEWPDGHAAWLDLRAYPTEDGLALFYRDVTDRKRAEQALRDLNAGLEQQVLERSRELARIWQVSPDLLSVINAEGVFEQVNPAWLNVLGWSPVAAGRLPFMEYVHPEDREATRAAWLAAREGRPVLRFVMRCRGEDGAWRWLSWVAIPEGDKLYCSARDVTAETVQASELAAAQEALRQSQKMEAVGQLTGGLAHDFNNLLTGITGSLELLLTRVGQGRFDGIDRYVGAAQVAARRAASLTHRLLAFSRRQTLAPRATDVARLVEGMAELVGHTMGPEIAVETVAASGLWTVLVDPSQLESALLNLCINARDAMPQGGRLTIETANRVLDERAARTREMPPGRYVSLCVSDDGSGMAPDVVARAFDPFFTTKPLGQGTGLGLSMIYGFVRQSGGQVRIHSVPGGGTKVCLYLPHHAGEPEPATGEADHDALPAGRGETVLVVDDEATVRMLVAEVLDDLGYVTLEAADGAAGLAVLRSAARVDLLITDVGLPGGMNGRQLADAARLHRPSLRVLFITGYAEAAVLSHGHLETGMQVLAKPFAIEALASRVRGLLAGA